MGKVYDLAFKTDICKRAVEDGEAVSAISREVGISENTLYWWVARYRENKEKPFIGSGHKKLEDEVFKKLLRENKELREEAEISLSYLSYNLRRGINILGAADILKRMRESKNPVLIRCTRLFFCNLSRQYCIKTDLGQLDKRNSVDCYTG